MRRRRLSIWIPLLLLGPLALPPASASARPATTADEVVIGVDDAVAIARTHIGCYGVTGGGTDSIACFKVDSEGLARGTFGIGIAENGTVTAFKIQSNRTPKRIFKRTLSVLAVPEAPAAPASTIQLGVGRTFNLEGTNILCQIVKITRGVPPLYRGVKVGCFGADTIGPLPSRYGVSMTDKFVGVFRVNPDRSSGANVFLKAQP